MDSKYPHKESEYTWIRDRGGSTLKLQRFEGLQYFPTYPPRVLQAMKQIKRRPDDIYLTTFQRTGTQWVFEMISMLLNQKAETIPANKEKSQIEFESNASLSALPSPRVINTHMSLIDSPKELVERKCKIMFTLRDPKDVAVSMYHFYTGFKKETDYDGKFAHFLSLFLDGKVDCGGLFRHWRSSEEFLDKHPDIPVHFMAFENPVLALQNLSDFLGLTRNDTLCQQIAQQCHIAKMKAGKTFTSEDNKLLYRKGLDPCTVLDQELVNCVEVCRTNREAYRMKAVKGDFTRRGTPLNRIFITPEEREAKERIEMKTKDQLITLIELKFQQNDIEGDLSRKWKEVKRGNKAGLLAFYTELMEAIEEKDVSEEGVVGDGRSYFKEEMLEDYYRVYEEKMAGSRFYQRYAREELPSQTGPLSTV